LLFTLLTLRNAKIIAKGTPKLAELRSKTIKLNNGARRNSLDPFPIGFLAERVEARHF